MRARHILGLCFALASCGASATTRTFNGEYGCDRLEDQLERLSLMAKATAAAGRRAQGRETPALKAEDDRIAERMIEISSTACVPLSGRFKVLRQQAINGGHAVLVQHDPGMRELWVLEP